jgi:RNA methyltransferase, TrmH family
MKDKEVSLCGLAAVRARFESDPASIKRLFFDYETGRKVGAICKALAAARKVYRCVEPAELERIAGSVHHGGIVAVAVEKPLRTPKPDELRTWARQRAPLLVLDRVGNAHNLGAIARTAAFFGVERIVIADHPQQALPGEAAHRVAEGGLEHVEILSARNLAAFCRELAAAGYEVAGTAVRGATPVDAAARNGKTSDSKHVGSEVPRPVALVMGNEEHGLAPEVAKACTRLVTIPGSGRVESLNVSVAAAVLMWELWARCR